MRIADVVARFRLTRPAVGTLLLAVLLATGCEKSDMAADAFNKARELTLHGKYEAALQQHLWFHNHALEVSEGYYGARLSVALTEWVALGEKFPPARKALVEIRDRQRDGLKTGGTNYNSFHEVVAISKELGEPQVAVELFKHIDGANPKFAAAIYVLIEETLAASGEFALARKHIGTPAQRLATAQKRLEQGLNFAADKGSPESRSAFEAIFVEDAVRLIAILDRTDGAAAARQIQAEALKILDRAAIRDALKK